MVFYFIKRWTIKKAENKRIDAFELWCWRRLLRVPWTVRRSNQSILKEINLEYSLEGLMLKMKLQYFGHLMGRGNSLEKTLMLGKAEGRRRKWWEDGMAGWHHQLNGHELEKAEGDSEGQGRLVCCSLSGCREKRLSDWTTTKDILPLCNLLIIYDFPGGSDGKASVYNAGEPGLIPGSGRSPAEGNGNPLQYYCLENPMDRGAWRATVHGVAKSQKGLSD